MVVVVALPGVVVVDTPATDVIVVDEVAAVVEVVSPFVVVVDWPVVGSVDVGSVDVVVCDAVAVLVVVAQVAGLDDGKSETAHRQRARHGEQQANGSGGGRCRHWIGSGAADGNRTRTASLEDWGSAIELRPPVVPTLAAAHLTARDRTLCAGRRDMSRTAWDR